MAVIHIFYHSDRGHTERLAESISQGVDRVGGCSSRIIPVEKATIQQVTSCQGLALGCPTHMGNVSASMKQFMDDVLCDVWKKGGLPGVVGSAFTSSGSLHGGKEFALLAMHITMFQLGMTVVSLPPMSIPENKNLGYSHGVGTSVLGRQPSMIPPEDVEIARCLGKRIAETAFKLHG